MTITADTGALRADRHANAGPALEQPREKNTDSIESLKRELRRTSEAYFTVLREFKAAKKTWEEREALLVGETKRLKTSLVALERYKVEHSEVLAAAIAGRDVAASAVATISAAREATEIAKRGKESAERRAEEADFTAKLATDRAIELGAAGLEIIDAKARELSLSRRAEAAEARVITVSREKDSLLDFVQVRHPLSQSHTFSDGVRVLFTPEIHPPPPPPPPFLPPPPPPPTIQILTT